MAPSIARVVTVVLTGAAQGALEHEVQVEHAERITLENRVDELSGELAMAKAQYAEAEYLRSMLKARCNT